MSGAHRPAPSREMYASTINKHVTEGRRKWTMRTKLKRTRLEREPDEELQEPVGVELPGDDGGRVAGVGGRRGHHVGIHDGLGGVAVGDDGTGKVEARVADPIAVDQRQVLIEANADLVDEEPVRLGFGNALHRRVLLEHGFDGVEDVLGLVGARLVWHDAALGQDGLHVVFADPVEAALEVLGLVVEGWQRGGARAVLDPFVPPEVT